MNRRRWLISGARVGLSVFALSLTVGCGGDPGAGTDPVDREKTLNDAKNAMEEAGRLQKASKSKGHGGK